jgi:hypothetical protein
MEGYMGWFSDLKDKVKQQATNVAFAVGFKSEVKAHECVTIFEEEGIFLWDKKTSSTVKKVEKLGVKLEGISKIIKEQKSQDLSPSEQCKYLYNAKQFVPYYDAVKDQPKIINIRAGDKVDHYSIGESLDVDKIKTDGCKFTVINFDPKEDRIDTSLIKDVKKASDFSYEQMYMNNTVTLLISLHAVYPKHLICLIGFEEDRLSNDAFIFYSHNHSDEL